MTLSLLENNWELIKERVVDKLWQYKFKSMYEKCKLDKDDFDSLANVVLTKAFKDDYNQNFSNIFTYATNVLDRKAKSELTYYHREKRWCGIPELSMQQMISNDEDIAIEDTICFVEENGINPLTQRYLDSLPAMQRRVAELIMSGYDNVFIKSSLGLSDDRFNMIFRRMKSEEKLEPLYKLRGVIK